MKNHKFFSLLVLLFATCSSLLAETKTIAISYFDNTSGLEQYNPLSKGLADMLITDLSNVKSIQIVEREKLESLLKEIDLGEGKFIDPNTAQKLGKGLGADYILTGAFLSIDPMMRIDARIMEVATGKIIGAEEITGKSNEFFILEKKLANSIIDLFSKESNHLIINNGEKNIQIESINQFSKAIDQYDNGNIEMAEETLNQLIAEDQNFKKIISNIGALNKKIAYLEEMINFRLGRFEEKINIAIEDPIKAWENIFISRKNEKLIPLAQLTLSRYREQASFGLFDKESINNGLIYCYNLLGKSYNLVGKYNVAMAYADSILSIFPCADIGVSLKADALIKQNRFNDASQILLFKLENYNCTLNKKIELDSFAFNKWVQKIKDPRERQRTMEEQMETLEALKPTEGGFGKAVQAHSYEEYGISIVNYSAGFYSQPNTAIEYGFYTIPQGVENDLVALLSDVCDKQNDHQPMIIYFKKRFDGHLEKEKFRQIKFLTDIGIKKPDLYIKNNNLNDLNYLIKDTLFTRLRDEATPPPPVNKRRLSTGTGTGYYGSTHFWWYQIAFISFDTEVLDVLNNLAWFYLEQNKPDSALIYLKEAEDYYEKHEYLTSDYKKHAMMGFKITDRWNARFKSEGLTSKNYIYCNIGNAYLIMGKYEDSMKYYELISLDSQFGDNLLWKDGIKSDLTHFYNKGILKSNQLNKLKKLYPEFVKRIGI